MGFFDSLRMQMMIQISRPGYFPGNVIEGNVIVNVMAPVEYYGIHLILEGKETVLVQHCRQVPNGGGAVLIEEHRRHGHHHHRRDEEVVVAVADGGFHEEWYVEEREAIITRRVVTLAGSYSAVLASRDNGQRPGFFASISNHIQDMGRPKQYLQPGNYVFPFQLALPAGIPASFCSGAAVGDFWDRPAGANPLRSRDDIAAAIGYWLKGDVEVPNGRDVTQRVPFNVYAPMPSRQWQNPCPAVVDRFWDLTCCCCIPKGKVSARLAVDRTVIALDRDAVPVRVAVDNTQGEVKLRSVKATLVSKCRVNMPGIGNRSQRNTVAITTVPLDLAPGQRREVDGVLRFSPACVPTIHGALVHIDYEVVLELDVEGASNERQAFPVVVAQTVDMSDAMPVLDFAAATFYRPFDPSTPHQVYYAPPPGASNVPNFVTAPSGAAFMTAAQPTITIFPNPTGFTVAAGPGSPQFASPTVGYGAVAYGAPVGGPASPYVAM